MFRLALFILLLAAIPLTLMLFEADLRPTPPAGDFVLESAEGPLALSDHHGEWVVLYFGYAACPDICPNSLARWSKVFRELEQQEGRRPETLLFISVDPNRDQPSILRPFARFFHPAFDGITGSEQVIVDVAERYHVDYRRGELTGSAMGYSVDHTTYSYLIDPRGELVAMFPDTLGTDQLLEAVAEEMR
ncbi:MAG: SCO family protein [Guyparkeria sp.]